VNRSESKQYQGIGRLEVRTGRGSVNRSESKQYQGIGRLEVRTGRGSLNRSESKQYRGIGRLEVRADRVVRQANTASGQARVKKTETGKNRS
jgi:hypothetical protein